MNITIRHCRVSRCSSNGITFSGDTPLDLLSFLENDCTAHAGYGISISADKLINLSGTGSFTGNGKGGKYVAGTSVWENGTWKKHDVPNIVDGVIDISNSDGVTVTMEPGTEFHFLQGSDLQVGSSSSGTLVAAGTPESPITFTTAVPETVWEVDATGADGGGIRIDTHTTAQTILRSCIVKDATSGIYTNTPATIQSCTMTNNRDYGLIVDTKATTAAILGNNYPANGIDSVYNAM